MNEASGLLNITAQIIAFGSLAWLVFGLFAPQKAAPFLRQPNRLKIILCWFLLIIFVGALLSGTVQGFAVGAVIVIILFRNLLPPIKKLESDYEKRKAELDALIEAKEKEIAEKHAMLEGEMQQTVANEKKKLESDVIELRQKVQEMKNDYADLTVKNQALLDEFLKDVDEITTSSVTDDEGELAIIKTKIKNMMKEQTQDQPAEKRKAMKQMHRLFMLQSLEVLRRARMDNNQITIERIIKCFTSTNNLFSEDEISIDKKLLELRIEEAKLVNQIMIKKYQEKEDEKDRKQFLREQMQAEKEMNAALKQIEKDRRQFTNEIKRTELALKDSSDESVTKYLLEKIEELKGKISDLKSKETDIDYRLKNARAGFVYIISNIGSFGEHVFKIGMTRRLDPYERIRELSSASVPYNFDVHAILFSEDAPALETALHEKYAPNALNLINHRKEFFKVDPNDLQETVIKLDPAARFVFDAPAEDFYASEKLRHQ